MRLGATVTAALILCALGRAAAEQPLVLVQTIELPGVEGRIDHLAVDRVGRRLFVAALGNNSLEVVDLAANTHLRSVKGLHEPQGVAFLDDSRQVVVANGQGGAVEIRDGSNLAVVRTVTPGDDADNVRYDAAAKRIYVGYASALGAIDAATGRRAGDIALRGHPESFQLDPAGARVYVNVPTARQVAVIDRTAMKMVATWPVTAAEANYPMAVDWKGGRLFIGARRPARLLVLDLASGRTTSSIDIVGDTDDLFFDAARKRLYIAGGEGFVDVLAEGTAGFQRAARVPTAAGARTALFVPDQNRLYVAVPHRGGQKAEIRVFEARD